MRCLLTLFVMLFFSFCKHSTQGLSDSNNSLKSKSSDDQIRCLVLKTQQNKTEEGIFCYGYATRNGKTINISGVFNSKNSLSDINSCQSFRMKGADLIFNNPLSIGNLEVSTLAFTINNQLETFSSTKIKTSHYFSEYKTKNNENLNSIQQSILECIDSTNPDTDNNGSSATTNCAPPGILGCGNKIQCETYYCADETSPIIGCYGFNDRNKSSCGSWAACFRCP